MLSRTTDKVEIEMGDEVETYQIIKLNEFSSDRKMMSIVVRRESDDLVMCYVKGADMAVYMRILNNSGPQEKSLYNQLERYADQGLRTLMFACRKV